MKSKNLSVYEFNFKYKDSWGKFINDWILYSLEIEKIKSELTNEKVYHWKESDFINKKMSLLKYSLFREKINSKKPMFEKEGLLYFYQNL
jgi:superfamily II DNA or RNA helicase